MGTWRPVTSTPINIWGPLPPHATPPRRPSRLRWLERVLIAIGIASLGYYAYVSAETALYQQFETRELDAILASIPDRPDPAVAPLVRRPPPARGSVIGRIEIPR